MEQSIIHIKAPHTVHIGAKVMAARHSMSMNQYIVQLIQMDLDGNSMPPAKIQDGIDLARKATPRQRKILQKAAEVIDEVSPNIKINKDNTISIKDPTKLAQVVNKKIELEDIKLCKDGHIANQYGKCLQKGCKFA